MPRRLVVAVVALVAVTLLAAGALWWRAQPSSEFERAVSLAPDTTERLLWTDWAAVRAELDATDLDASSSPAELEAFLNTGYERDLTSSSALLQSAGLLQDRFGFSPASLDWELFSQSAEGAVIVMRLADDVDADKLGSRFESLGFERPDSDTGIWRGGPDVLATIGPNLTPELQYLAIDADEHLLLASDTGGYLADVVDDLGDGSGPSGLDDVVAASQEPVSAAVYTGPHACAALAMSSASEPDQAHADQLIAEAGEVNPITGFAMSAQPDGGIRVALSFENDEQARRNADSRAALARGPAPGQGGDFSDRFTVEQVTADGSTVVLDLDPVEGEYVLSDLGSGPVLFATC